VRNISRLIRHALGVLVAVILVGCSSGGPQAQIPSDSTQITPRAVIATHPDLGPSWMNPTARGDRLLYVTGSGVVNVYTYPEGNVVGQLGGFRSAAGMCSGTNGDVWITDFRGAKIVEYAHGGIHPVRILSEPGTAPEGCSVDPTTGNLAVTGQIQSGPSGSSAFAIYTKAKGPPRLYSVSFGTLFCGYDNKGNLFVDGVGGQQPQFVLAELRKGHSSVETIALNQFISSEPGAVQWDAKHLLVGDADAKVVYAFTIHAGYGTKVGEVSVDFGEGRIGQFWVQGSRLIVPTYIGSGPSVQVYIYPSGVGPVRTITGLDSPYGVAVSVAPK
jgi:hypothetical protein